MPDEVVQELLAAGAFSHSCIVVDDIEAVYAAYQSNPGAVLTELKQTNAPDIAKAVYRGQSTPTRARQFFVTMGGLRTEVLQPDEHPSVWAEVLKNQGGSSLHHMGFDVEDAAPVIRYFEGKGIGVLQTGNYIGGRYTYLDTQRSLGMILELLEKV